MLTKELILSKKPNIFDISSIKKLKICSSNISDISIISRMKNLEILFLSSNKISSLYALSQCENLRELNLRNNYIFSFDELYFLQNLQKLRMLSLEGNPISHSDNYLDKVLKILPNLHYLDNKKVSDIKNIKNRNRQYKYLKRVLTEEKKVTLENYENKNIVDISSYKEKKLQGKKKLFIKRAFSYFDTSNTETKKENSINTSNNKNSYNKYMKFNNKDKGKSERKEINYKNIKLKFRKQKRTIYNNILLNTYLKHCQKIPNIRRQTVDINANNININHKQYMKSNNTAQISLKHQNSSELKKYTTINTKVLFKGKNILNRKNEGNIKNLKLYKYNETKECDNNYVMAASLLVNKIDIHDLILLKKVINKKMELLSK